MGQDQRNQARQDGGDTVQCGACGAANPEGSQVCAFCGAPLPPVSPTSLGVFGPSRIGRELRPMGAGDILDEAIRLYRHNFRTFVGIVAVLQVPILLLQMIQLAIVGPNILDFSRLGRSSEPLPGSLIFGSVSSLALGGLSFLAFLFIEAALAAAISERYLGRRITVGRAYRATISCFWRMLGTVLVTGLILIFLAITIVFIPAAVFFGIRWAFVVQAIAIERAGVRRALFRSSRLVKGSWWRVLAIVILAAILQLMVAGLPASMIGAVLGGAAMLLSPGGLFAFSVVNTLVGSVFGILAAPLIPIIATLLYYDLRVRNEGFDLQVLAERLAQARVQAGEGQT
ncbi:MAG: glycerophosphoryl diester phosphodiesterase membrane domain-containing protein [Chloroflexi bacterium]|nr:glycerophosphoryl diester phosphodiesterase membrane domain-containing protein [Chloroflexota bacterium]